MLREMRVIRRFMSTVNRNGPLTGVKVLDMTRVFAGPVCTLALADFGAYVYKIENPCFGDDSRRWPPFVNDLSASCSFIGLNRNKKSVCVNFKTKDGQRILHGLAETCDILVENYIPGTLRKYRLDYESLRLLAPHLIYCSITGFGPTGPYSKRPGVDLIAASMSGHLHMTGPENGEPCRSSTSTIDIMAGLRAHGAILAALYDRKSSGQGCKIDVDLFSSGLVALSNYCIANLNLNIEPFRMGTEHSSVVPYKSFKSKDGYITVGAINDEKFREFCEKVSVPMLVEDERFMTADKRVRNRKELISILTPIFVDKTTEEWCRIFEKSSLPYGPLNTLDQVLSDPHVKAIDIVKEVEHPVIGRVKLLDSPVKFNNYQNEVKCPPLLGQHTTEVLKEILHYSDEQIKELKRKKSTTPPTLRLKCRKPKPDKSVRWNEGTVDNENMNKKKSKCCCIYKKPKQRFDESSDSESNECDSCFGHVQVKKQKQLANTKCSEESSASASKDVIIDSANQRNSADICMAAVSS